MTCVVHAIYLYCVFKINGIYLKIVQETILQQVSFKLLKKLFCNCKNVS
jgi:hypothetical protein